MYEKNVKLLEKIIDDNKNTEYEKKYGFSKIKNVEDYKSLVPLTKYVDYEPFIQRMFDGEKNILTVYPILTYVMTTGSENFIQKYLPYSVNAVENIALKPFVIRDAIFEKYKKENKNINKCHILYIGIIHVEMDDLKEEFPKTFLLSDISYAYLCRNKTIDLKYYLGGFDLMFDANTYDVLYEKIWISILEEDILEIETIYMYSILQFFIEFEKSYKDIISDIRKKQINPKKKLSDKAKKYLLNLPVSEERLKYVEKECQKGFDGIALRLWKNMKLITGITSKTFIYENKALNRFIKDIPINTFLYASSESFIGFPKEINSFSYLIDPTFSFYEFIPFNENNNNEDKTVALNEVENDKKYEMVLTNLSGLYRYKTGDIIKIIKNNESEIFVEFCFRKNILINIKQEKFANIHFEQTKIKMDEIIPNIFGFLLGGTTINNIGYYFSFLCLDDNNILNIDVNELEKKLDSILIEVNMGYRLFRKSNDIGNPKIFIKNKEEFSKIQQFIKKTKSHNKPKYIIPESLLRDLLKTEGYINSSV